MEGTTGLNQTLFVPPLCNRNQGTKVQEPETLVCLLFFSSFSFSPVDSPVLCHYGPTSTKVNCARFTIAHKESCFPVYEVSFATTPACASSQSCRKLDQVPAPKWRGGVVSPRVPDGNQLESILSRNAAPERGFQYLEEGQKQEMMKRETHLRVGSYVQFEVGILQELFYPGPRH